jgi:hypothetical protein
MSFKQRVVRIAFVILATLDLSVGAAVTHEEAERLKSELTPLGAERAGNKEGTIPDWDGGYIKVWPGYQSGQPRPDPFADEKPRLRITAKNVDQYADHLSDGIKELFRRFPDYRLDVYPTHRTAAAPQWVYDNTFRNATRGKTAHGGVSAQDVYGGVPFPIPHDGSEAMWNHLLAWKGESGRHDFATYVVTAGKVVLASTATLDWQYPYYYRDASLKSFDGVFGLGRVEFAGPPTRAGEAIVTQEPVDAYNQPRRAWQYLVGQRRVRRAPAISYDNAVPTASGLTFSDESFLFNGALDRYEWKLLGKQQMFVPYNTQKFHTAAVGQVLGSSYPNPDYVRWELHRVWVVEATVAPGKRHAIPKRRFYLDEDTWLAVLSDGWDAGGQLWHVGYALPFIVPELPAVVVYPYVMHDLLKGGYVASSLFNGAPHHYEITRRRPEDMFSPATLSAEGIR